LKKPNSIALACLALLFLPMSALIAQYLPFWLDYVPFSIWGRAATNTLSAENSFHFFCWDC